MVVADMGVLLKLVRTAVEVGYYGFLPDRDIRLRRIASSAEQNARGKEQAAGEAAA
jgi:hypothetical protein